MKKWLSSLTIIGTLIFLGACNNDEAAEEDTSKEENTEEVAKQEEGAAEEGAAAEGQEQAEAPEPDLEGIPDVVAEVNGTEIDKASFEEAYQAQFQQAAMMSQMSGEELNQDDLKKQVADGLVNQELLIQEADNRELGANDDEKNEMITELTESNGMESEDDLYAAFEEQGMDKDQVMEQVELQIKVDKLIAEETGEVKPSEDELQELYDQQVKQLEQMETEEEPPSFDEMKPQLEKQVVSQKEGEAAQGLVEKLKEDAEVEVHV